MIEIVVVYLSLESADVQAVDDDVFVSSGIEGSSAEFVDGKSWLDDVDVDDECSGFTIFIRSKNRLIFRRRKKSLKLYHMNNFRAVINLGNRLNKIDFFDAINFS